MDHRQPQSKDDLANKPLALPDSRFDPVADFYDSKQHTLTQLAQRIRELALSEDDKSLLARLESDEIRNLRDSAEECCAALTALESDFDTACEEALVASEGGEGEFDDEDDVEPAPRPMTTSLEEFKAAEAWHLLDSYGPTLVPSEKDFAASRRAGKLISSVPTACWFNARRLIEVVDEFTDAALIEGYVMSAEEGRYFEHGWVVHCGKIIDPTLPDEDYEYFAGLEFIGRQSIAAFDRVSLQESRRTREDPFFHAFGWGGQDSPHMRNAHKAAEERFRKIVKGNGT